MSGSKKEVPDSLQKFLFHEDQDDDSHDSPSNLTVHEFKQYFCLQQGDLCSTLII